MFPIKFHTYPDGYNILLLQDEGIINDIYMYMLASFDYCTLSQYLNPVIRGAPQSDHHITTSFGAFRLPTYGLLWKGRDHSTFGVWCLSLSPH